jgi:O-antigen/teichoic acid export membrane protein
MHKILNYLKGIFISKSSFTANVLTLVMGISVSQIIPILALLVLTRIYSPQHFGIFAIYTSVVSAIAVISTGGYEFAVMLPDKDEDALNIVVAILIICFFISSISFIILGVFNIPIAKMLGNSEISFFLYLVPLMVFPFGAYQAFYYWLNRKKEYKKITINKIIQALFTAAALITMGFMGFGAGGLIYGGIAGQLLASTIMGCQIWKENKGQKVMLDYNYAKKLLKRYRGFPRYALPTNFINTIAIQIPTVLLNNFFGSLIVGFFGLTQRVFQTPISLISLSVRDVFIERASSDYRNKGSCTDIFLKTFKGMSFFSFVLFLIVFLTGPILFSVVFGNGWRLAGRFAQILSPVLFLRMLIVPLGNVFNVIEKQKIDLFFNIYMLVSTVMVLFLSYYFLKKVEYVLVVFSINLVLIYIVYLFFAYTYSKKINR